METSNKNITQDEIPQAITPNEDEVSNESDENSENEVLRTRSLVNIYNSCNMALLEPESFDEASKLKEWRASMEEEMMMILKNETWTLVDRPINKKVIGVRWVYRTKLNVDGSINKFKARLVAKDNNNLIVLYLATSVKIFEKSTPCC